MPFPKFIIEDGKLIIGKVFYHKDLCTDPTKVKGGGWFYNKDINEIVFHKDSHDFGKASLEDVKSCVINNCVVDKRGDKILIGYKFYYDTGSELIKLN